MQRFADPAVEGIRYLARHFQTDLVGMSTRCIQGSPQFEKDHSCSLPENAGPWRLKKTNSSQFLYQRFAQHECLGARVPMLEIEHQDSTAAVHGLEKMFQETNL